MAGTFAHLTLVDKLCRDGDTLDTIDTLTPAMKRALTKFSNFCELGAVGPDLPYLERLSADASRWANVMHYWKTADFVRYAVPLVYDMNFSLGDSQKCIAWLFGYAAHLVTDLTIHPVVNIRVGHYDEHPRMHRICEINQDIYIFHKQGFGDITTAEFIKNCGIGSCADPTDDDKLDAAVRDLWSRCLEEGYPRNSIKMKSGLKTPKRSPDPNEWFEHYVRMIDKFAEEGGKYPCLCRNIFEAVGVVYPQFSDVDMKFIRNLEIPGEGDPTNYDDIFERTRQSVISTWRELGAALDKGKSELFTLVNGDLDTGRDSDNHLIFWEGVA